MNWTEIINKVNTADLPYQVRIDEGAVITDVKKFIEGHITIVQAMKEGRSRSAYEDRLMKVLLKLKIISEDEIEPTKKA